MIGPPNAMCDNRYLMDGLRNEEAKRQKLAILKYFNLNEKTDPKTVNKVGM